MGVVICGSSDSASDRNGRYSRTMAFWRAMLEVAIITGWNGSPSTSLLWLYTMAAVKYA